MASTKNNRSSYQTARAGWRPEKTSDRKLAKDIVASIEAHAEVGTVKTAADYTNRSEVITLVESIMEG